MNSSFSPSSKQSRGFNYCSVIKGVKTVLTSNSLKLYIVFYLLFLYVPILFIPLFSFNTSSVPVFPLSGLTTNWYQKLATQSDLLSALKNSLLVGGTTAIISTVLGTMAAWGVTRYRFPGKQIVLAVIMSPLFLPVIILAIALLIMFLSMGINLSLMTVTVAHILISIPFSTAIMGATFAGFDNTFEEAAIDLGENAWGAFWRVVLPISFPSFISSLLITFTISFDEFLLAFFLAGTEPTLPLYIWAQVRFPAKLPIVLALSSLVIVASFILILAATLLRRNSLTNANITNRRDT